MSWHYVDEHGEVTGPVTLDDIRTMLPDHSGLNIWSENGGNDWIIVKSTIDIDNLGESESEKTDIANDLYSLPDEWEAHIDEASNTTFFHNESTGVTTWELADVHATAAPSQEGKQKPEPEEKQSDVVEQSAPAAPQAISSNPPLEPDTKTLRRLASTKQIHTIQKHASDLAQHVRDEATKSGVLYNRSKNTDGGTTTTKLVYNGPWQDVYETRCLPDNKEWLEILRACRQNGQVFEDTDFPADDTSIWRDVSKKSESPHKDQCSEAVMWRRIKDILHQTVYVKITFAKMTKQQSSNSTPKIAGFAIIQEDEYVNVKEKEDGSRTMYSSIYHATAKIGAEHGLNLKSDDLTSMCTDFVSKWLNTETAASSSEKEGAGSKSECESNSNSKKKSTTNFDAFWGSILAVAAPCHFKKFGQILSWEEKATGPGVLPFVRVVVPLDFSPHRIQLFERDSPSRPLVAPGDVRQGILGDCYYLGALSVVSTHPTMLFDLFPDIDEDLVIKANEVEGTPQLEQEANSEGLYAVRFWREGQWRIVIVDDRIPCNASGRPCFAQLPEHGCEIWVLIAEKAYAKMNGMLLCYLLHVVAVYSFAICVILLYTHILFCLLLVLVFNFYWYRYVRSSGGWSRKRSFGRYYWWAATRLQTSWLRCHFRS
jgi:hypothetical protein